LVCGFVQCDDLRFHPILRHLPHVLRVESGGEAADDWLAGTIRHVAGQTLAPSPGSRSVLSRLTEVMFLEVLRKHVKDLTAEQAGWFSALNDPVVGAALRRMHAAPLHDWSIDTLARSAGTSRTVLTERFRRYLEVTPMRYLAQWRLQLAAHELETTDVLVKAVADRAGYESEAAFNRAFKRLFGCPPGDWRGRRHAQ